MIEWKYKNDFETKQSTVPPKKKNQTSVEVGFTVQMFIILYWLCMVYENTGNTSALINWKGMSIFAKIDFERLKPLYGSQSFSKLSI